MERIARPSLLQRGLAMLALLIPVCAGIAYLALFGAPASYVLMNSGALAVGLLWALFVRLPDSLIAARSIMAGLVVLLALPLVTGPQVEGFARWVALGGFTLHVGMAAIPLIAVLSARDEKLGITVLLVAILAAGLQPDPGSMLALFGAAIGNSFARRDFGRLLVLCVCAVLAVGGAALVNNLPPQPFVERVILDLFAVSPLAALGLSLSLIASIAMMVRAPEADKAARFALAGTLFGFTLAALIADYPTPLVGYGAAAILGYALALGVLAESSAGNAATRSNASS